MKRSGGSGLEMLPPEPLGEPGLHGGPPELGGTNVCSSSSQVNYHSYTLLFSAAFEQRLGAASQPGGPTFSLPSLPPTHPQRGQSRICRPVQLGER